MGNWEWLISLLQLLLHDFLKRFLHLNCQCQG
jgi:hypothetical protein